MYEDLRRRSAKEAVARSRYTLRNGRGLDGYYIAGMGLGETAEQRKEVRHSFIQADRPHDCQSSSLAHPANMIQLRDASWTGGKRSVCMLHGLCIDSRD